MAKRARFAIVTPYYRETRGVLERCIASARAQSCAADHFLVADGFPQSWIDGAGVRHIKLDEAHRDYGNVARGVGALLAVADGYEGVGFLDADNWLEPDHVALCIDTVRGADLAVAKRRFVRPDGRDFRMAEEPGHIDTSCWWFGAGAFHLLSFWTTIPRELTPIGDRVFTGLVESKRLSMREAPHVTVNYTCLWEGVYRRFGETPPPGAKPDIDLVPVLEWLVGLSDEKRRMVAKLCAGDLVPWAERALAQMRAERLAQK